MMSSSAPVSSVSGKRHLLRGRKPICLGVTVRSNDVHADHCVGLLQLLGRLETRTINLQCGHEVRRREMRGESVGQAEFRCQHGPEMARPENPERHARSGGRDGLHALARLQGPEEGLQLHDILRKSLCRFSCCSQRAKGDLVGAGRTAQPEVYTPGEQAFEGAKLFRNHDRGMVRQHDATGADADLLRTGSNVRDHQRRGCAGDPRHVVVLGDPDTIVVPLLGMRRQVACIVHGRARIRALCNADQVENGKLGHDGLLKAAARRGRVCMGTPVHSTWASCRPKSKVPGD